jgi:hypothetical protein
VTDDELIQKLAKIGDEYLTFTWAGSKVCFWCSVVEPEAWDDHDNDCAGLLARKKYIPTW